MLWGWISAAGVLVGLTVLAAAERPFWLWVSVLVFGLFVAQFFAWRDLYLENNRLEHNLDALRDIEVIFRIHPPRGDEADFVLPIEIENSGAAGHFRAESMWLHRDGREQYHPPWMLRWVQRGDLRANIGQGARDQVEVVRVAAGELVVPVTPVPGHPLDHKRPLEDGSRLRVRVFKEEAPSSAQHADFTFIPHAETMLWLEMDPET